ncbi:MAG: methylmalonyl-CoA mutase family protein, partial [Anaerolineales bacterium]
QQEVEAGQQIVVGVNAFQTEEQLTLDQLRVDPEIETAQRAKLAELRESRDQNRVAELLGQLEQAARSETALMPLLIVCVENRLTLGEICNTLRQVWGEYQPSPWI